MENKTDLRILRTKKSIREAFLSLLQEKSFNRITVQDITDRAFINRNTFYLHYRDKEDLLRSLSMERLDNLQQIISKPHNENSEEYFRPLIFDTLREISQNQAFYRAMINDSSSTYFTENFKALIVNQMLEATQNKTPDYQTLFCIEYIVNGFIGGVRFSLEQPEELAVDKIADLIFHLVFDNSHVLDLL